MYLNTVKQSVTNSQVWDNGFHGTWNSKLFLTICQHKVQLFIITGGCIIWFAVINHSSIMETRLDTGFICISVISNNSFFQFVAEDWEAVVIATMAGDILETAAV